MKVVIMPGQMLCGSCGAILALGGMPRPPHFICPISCQNLQCTDFNKVSIFPLMGMELENVEPAGPQIIVPQ